MENVILKCMWFFCKVYVSLYLCAEQGLSNPLDFYQPTGVPELLTTFTLLIDSGTVCGTTNKLVNKNTFHNIECINISFYVAGDRYSQNSNNVGLLALFSGTDIGRVCSIIMKRLCEGQKACSYRFTHRVLSIHLGIHWPC